MSELDILLILSIAIVFATITIYVIYKKAIKFIETMLPTLLLSSIEAVKPQLKRELEEYVNSEKFQKAAMGIGALIGNGAKTGFGFQGSTKGKNGISGLIGDVLSQFINQKIPNIGQVTDIAPNQSQNQASNGL